MKILLTGFEPNDDYINASELVVRSIQDNPPSELVAYRHQIYCCILPGNTEILGKKLYELLDELTPDFCLFIGQARGYNRLNLERMALNQRFFVTLDRAGNAPKGLPVEPDGPTAYWTNIPSIDQLVTILHSHNIPAVVSNFGGTHLCNQSFYHGLHYAYTRHLPMQVGFVHIPALPEQVIDHWQEAPFMPLDMVRQALSLLMLPLLES